LSLPKTSSTPITSCSIPSKNLCTVTDPDQPVLEMSRITKEFPGVRALKDVTLQVNRAEVHGLVGENGAGKSTLMKILCGVYPHGSFAGELRIDGVRVEFDSPHDAQTKGIGFVPQEINVIEGLTVAENIFVGRLTTKGGLLVRFRNL